MSWWCLCICHPPRPSMRKLFICHPLCQVCHNDSLRSVILSTRIVMLIPWLPPHPGTMIPCHLPSLLSDRFPVMMILAIHLSFSLNVCHDDNLLYQACHFDDILHLVSSLPGMSCWYLIIIRHPLYGLCQDDTLTSVLLFPKYAMMVSCIVVLSTRNVMEIPYYIPSS